MDNDVARPLCPSCHSKKTVSVPNMEGNHYFHCLMCGCRFWGH